MNTKVIVQRNIKTNKIILSTLTAVFIVILTISFAVLVPIVFEPFYYLHIKPYHLEDVYLNNGRQLNYNEIKIVYDKLIRYLLSFQKFDLSPLESSVNGEAHFDDVRKLFLATFILFFLSLIGLITLIILNKKYAIKIPWINIGFYSLMIIFVIIIIIVAIAASDFEKAFEVFHKIFFPGKSNWNFAPNKDEIIKYLPQEFFMNAAITISFFLISPWVIFVILKIIFDVKKHKQKQQAKQKMNKQLTH
ncbi:TIGR01906 family membrane protein [Ureaplasma sp. ES3154-GEN]|uniref:TIGR01906 family membrane protein n=1 Tax=Ureaplasma sp. ES3154-GEN TaxID=2984844 RepID=UPI0021E77285|nr:TIGR01906 family membrane protein [Ureaplasma sp. ES3154-GEN]MCV3743776.1 TIGR01906 family membrane protein [Ureaplasma sp. ES3154-GEN]